MRTKVILFTILTMLSATSVAASETNNTTSQVKSREQIRCELVGDCQPLPVTRAWITRTGEVEANRANILREQQTRRQARLAVPGPQARPGPSRNRPSQLVIREVQSTDLFINFRLASWEIDDAAFSQATEVYAALTPAEWGTSRFEISGHTDALGSAPENEVLSMKRAQAVADLLVARGVNRSQLVVKGYGFRRPLKDLERMDGRNRRVGITKLN